MIPEIVLRLAMFVSQPNVWADRLDTTEDNKNRPIPVDARVVTRYGEPLVRAGRLINNQRNFYIFTVREVTPTHLRIEADGVHGWINRAKVLRFEQAIEFYTDQIEVARVSEAYAWRGLIHKSRGDYDLALADYDAAIRHDPSDLWAQRDRALLLDHQEKLGEALLEWNVVIRLNPRNAADLMNRSRAYWRANQLDQAFADANAALAIEPGNAPGLSLRGFLALKQQNYPAALADLNEALRIDPDYLPALDNRGNVHESMGHRDLAKIDFERMVRLNANDAAGHLGLGNVLVYQDQIDAAIKQYDEAIRLRPAWSTAWGNRADGHYRQGRFELARQDADEAIRLIPTDVSPRMTRASANYKLRQYEAALEDLDRAAEFGRSDGEFFEFRGEVHSRLNQYAPALGDYDRAARLRPDQSRSFAQQAWMFSDCPNAAIRDGVRAVELATKACELTHWSEPYSLGALAAGHAEAGHFDEAIRRAKEALVLIGQNDERAFYQYILDLFEMGQPYRADPY